jgi:hypothetical protein
VPLKQDNTVVRVTDTMTTTGTDSVTLVSAAWTADNASVTLSDSEVSYDGVNNAKIPTETVKFHNTTLVKDTDYTVSYQRNGAATTDLNSLGEVTVVITAKAPYSGTLRATYTVVRSSAVKTLIDQLTERTNAFKADTVTADDTAALNQLKSDINKALSDYAQVLTDSEKQTLNGLLTQVAALEKVISTVATDLNTLGAVISDYDIATVTADDAMPLSMLETALGRIKDSNLTAAQKAEKKALADKVAALQKVISDTAAELAAVKTAVAAYDEDTVTADDKTDLEALAARIAAIPDSNLTAAQKSEKKAMADAIAAMEKTLADTAADLAAFRAAVEAYDPAKLTAADKTGLEALLKQLQEYPTDHLTDAEKKTLSDLAKTVEGLIEAIEKAEEIAGDISAIEKLLEGKTEDTVTSDDEAELIAAGNAIEDLLRNGDLTEADRAKLAQLLKKVEDLLAHLEEAEKAAEVSEEVKDITPETVEPEDQETLEEAIEALEEALETYGDNYTEAEKKAIEAAIAALEESLAVIEAVEAVEKQIESLPETAEPDDEKAIEALKAAVAAYNALTDRQKAMISEDALDRMDTLAASLLNYKVTQGAEGEWTKGSEKSATLTVNGLLSKFVSVELDGKVVDPKHYTAVSGSTIITFHSTFLEDLSEGKHTVTVNFTDGKVEATLTIKAKPVNPETGDNAAPALLLLVALASFATAAALVIDRKRRAR